MNDKSQKKIYFLKIGVSFEFNKNYSVMEKIFNI